MFSKQITFSLAMLIGASCWCGCAPVSAETIALAALPPALFTPPQLPSPRTIPAPAPLPQIKADDAAIRAHTTLAKAIQADQTGQTAAAIKLYKQVLNWAAITGLPNMDAAIASGRLGALFAQLREIGQGIKYSKLAIEQFQKVEGPVSNDVAIELNNLAWLHNQLFERGIAERLYKQSLSILHASGDENGDLIGITENNLGDLLSDEHKGREALSHYENSYRFLKGYYGAEAKLTKMAAGKLAHCRRSLHQK